MDKVFIRSRVCMKRTHERAQRERVELLGWLKLLIWGSFLGSLWAIILLIVAIWSDSGPFPMCVCTV